jgi:rfaE bifunctional protein kinase chain/domain
MTTQQFESLFRSFDKLKVLIIGDVMLDSYVWGDVKRISPEAPVPIVSVVKKENRLGGAANVALNLKAMGAIPILCAYIGEDENGSLFKQLLQKEKLPTTGILSDKGRVTTTKIRIIGNNHQMLRVDEEINSDLAAHLQKKLLHEITKLLDSGQIAAVIFEDYDKGIINPKLIQTVVKHAEKLGIPTCVDPKKNNFLAFKNVTLFKPNLRELKEGLHLGNDLNQPKNLSSAVELLRKQLKNKITLITLSERGVFVSDKKTEKLIPAHLRTISDVSGAGDTVIAVATLCLATKTSIELLAALSNLAGGLVCEKVGVVPIDKQHLLKEAKLLLTKPK